MCEQHAALMRAIKKDLEDNPKELFSKRSKGFRKKRSKQVPTCCHPGCYNERIPPSDFCDGCADIGISD